MQQIDIAIEMFHCREWTCAITLALAAETQMPNPQKPLRSEYGQDFLDRLSKPTNWPRHVKEPETAILYEMDAVAALLRAISKFTSLYRVWSRPMTAFDAWVKRKICQAFDLSNSN